MQLSSFPSTTYWRQCLSSIVYSYLPCHRLIDHKCMGLFLSSLFSSIDLCVCFCASTIYCFDYCSFVLQSEVREHDTFSSVFLFQDCFGYSVFCVYFHTNFKIISSSSLKNVIGTLIEIALNLQIALGSMVILTILILPIHEHIISFHWFVSSSVSYISVSQFSEYRSFTSLGRLIPKYLFFLKLLKMELSS